MQPGWVAFNIETRQWVRLEHVAPSDSSHYDRPLLWAQVSNGSAFLAYSHENAGSVGSTLVEVVLDTGERIERDRWTGSYFTIFQSGESYVVYQRPWEGRSQIVAYDRATHRVFPINMQDSAGVEWARVGKEWLVNVAEGVDGQPPPLVAYKIATGERRVLVNGSEDWDWTDYDIEEPWVAIKIHPSYGSTLKTKAAQLYLYKFQP